MSSRRLPGEFLVLYNYALTAALGRRGERPLTEDRIRQHPILPITEKPSFAFYWRNEECLALEGETIAAALFANGVKIFGRHVKDGAPQGIFCANGQCAQCMVLVDGFPVKSCMELIRPGVRVEPAEGLFQLPGAAVPASDPLPFRELEEIRVPVLIIGGGPAGLSAAIELGKLGIRTLLIDDKHRLGGKLVLQTHRFFGSTAAVYAGTRGIDIATILEREVRSLDPVKVWTQSSALAVFSDGKVGVLKEGQTYVLVAPEVLLTASGAREKNLAFPGNTLPGVYGAGAFQTLVNRDLVRAARRLFIVGGGNVGLIAGYHALQAGISVAGLVEAMPECGGYKVHKDKLARFGVPIHTSHTIVSANGREAVESVTIARVDERFRIVTGTERSYACDTVLVAVGLDPVNEFHEKALAFGQTAFVAGDAEEIAEASAAIFSGKIRGLEIARALGRNVGEISPEWYETAEILKSKPGGVIREQPPRFEEGVFPVLHCIQEIPCDPCTAVCPTRLIEIDSSDIRKLPVFLSAREGKGCSGCEKCVAVCPGLAITLVDYRKDPEFPTVTIPYEFLKEAVHPGDRVAVQDTEGNLLGSVEVQAVRAIKTNDRTVLLKVRAPAAFAKTIAGIRIQPATESEPMEQYVERTTDDTIVCRCERVTAGAIRKLIREGARDVNQIKALTRASMGPCGAKTCTPLIRRLFREEGVADKEVVEQSKRPLFLEVPLGVFAGLAAKEDDHASK
jgi:sarcosine oxidase, subunit alpha